MLAPRRDAIAGARRGEPFDVLVIGGGITGAGVALDAATRGYSVALVERGDYAIGTSSRSSKLVHGGLRYLQNFDLGLVREALLERQINVALAPHLVRPLPLIVPAFDGARPDRLDRAGAEHVRRDGRRPAVAARAPPRPQPRRGGGLEPGAAPRDLRRGGRRAAARARRPQPERRLPLLRLPDRRRPARADRARRGRALRRGGRQRRRGARAAGGGRPRGRRARARRRERGELEIRAANVVNATGVWADRLRPASCTTRPRCRVIRPSRGTHIILPGATLPMRGRRDRARRRRAHDLRAPVARPDADRDHRQRLRGRPRARAALARRRRVPARGHQRLLRRPTSARATWRAPTPACGR